MRRRSFGGCIGLGVARDGEVITDEVGVGVEVRRHKLERDRPRQVLEFADARPCGPEEGVGLADLPQGQALQRALAVGEQLRGPGLLRPCHA